MGRDLLYGQKVISGWFTNSADIVLTNNDDYAGSTEKNLRNSDGSARQVDVSLLNGGSGFAGVRKGALTVWTSVINFMANIGNGNDIANRGAEAIGPVQLIHQKVSDTIPYKGDYWIKIKHHGDTLYDPSGDPHIDTGNGITPVTK